MSVEAPLEFVTPREPKPAWLKVRAPGSENYLRLKGIMKDLRLNTVCEDARCPNIGECWHHGTATFMILGDVCTRACAYCAVAHGKPNELDTAEPARVAEGQARAVVDCPGCVNVIAGRHLTAGTKPELAGHAQVNDQHAS